MSDDIVSLALLVVAVLGLILPIAFPPRFRPAKDRKDTDKAGNIRVVVPNRFPVRSASGHPILTFEAAQKVRAAEAVGTFLNRFGAFFAFGVLTVYWTAVNGPSIFTFSCQGLCSGPIVVGLSFPTFAYLLLIPLSLEMFGGLLLGYSRRQRQRNPEAWAQILGEELALRGFPPTPRARAALTADERDLLKRLEEEETR